ncbi:hypothetical protein VNO80_29068 [Phaseolus coccineus]|uniref:Uncharacterized protein n=1 Tax=Phaseolus coccineus TaxID=3886 RepID=A0AAN9LFA4_PHACN
MGALFCIHKLLAEYLFTKCSLLCIMLLPCLYFDIPPLVIWIQWLFKNMDLSRSSYAYSKVDKEDPEDIIRRRAQFLIHKVLEKADSRRKPSCLRLRISKLKVKIGRRLMRLRKRMISGVSSVRLGIQGHFMTQLKTWKRLFGRGRQSQTLITLPPLLT